MRFSYAEAMCDPAQYLPLARAAETAGFSTYLVPDSLCYPERSASKYPYTPDGSREFLEDKPFIEPFTLMAAMSAVTTRLRFSTFVLKLPVREPVSVAKSMTSLAVLSAGRVSFGVGTSPWPEDYEVCGQDWNSRGERIDEMIAIIRGLTRGEFFAFDGRHYQFPRIKLCPVPEQTIPILVGGHSPAALRRAARLGDGFMFAGGNSHELQRCLAKLTELRSVYGRSDPFEIHASSRHAYTLDGVKRLADQGVTDLVVGFRDAYARGPDTQPLEAKLEAIARYADAIMSKVEPS